MYFSNHNQPGQQLIGHELIAHIVKPTDTVNSGSRREERSVLVGNLLEVSVDLREFVGGEPVRPRLDHALVRRVVVAQGQGLVLNHSVCLDTGFWKIMNL